MATGQIGGTQATASAIMPDNDPANPYRSQYKAWDIWLANNLVMSSRGSLQHAASTLADQWNKNVGAEPPQGLKYYQLLTEIEHGNCLVPVSEGTRRFQESVSNNSVKHDEGATEWIGASGYADPTTVENQWKSDEAIAASYYPRIPAWVAKDYPDWAYLMPNGDVICNRLVSGQASSSPMVDARILSGKKQEHFYRYSHDGKLLGTADASWFEFYYDAAKYGPLSDVKIETDARGITSITDSQGRTTRWDFDGTPHNASRPLDDHCFQRISKPFLITLYTRQNN